MSNQKVEQKQEQVEQQVQEVQQQPEQVQQVVVVQQPSGFKTWFKNHWKAVVGSVVGAAGVATSAVVAYKKGKAAGSMPMQEQEDYSLNPNE